MRRIQVAAGLARHLGLPWVLFRGLHAVRRRTGLFVRRHPPRTWTDVLAPVPADWARLWREGSLPFVAPAVMRSMQEPLVAWDAGGMTPLTEAEELLRGRFLLFGGRTCDVGDPLDWHRNPLTGERAPHDVHWSRLDDFGHGDIKCIWELSRFGFVYPLARAYARTGDNRFAECFWALVESWAAGNPPALGVNWKCGQETALRLMAWCFGAAVFADAPATCEEACGAGFQPAGRTAGSLATPQVETEAGRMPAPQRGGGGGEGGSPAVPASTAPPTTRATSATAPPRLVLLGRLIEESARRIEINLAYALSQNNNHGLSELAGLITAALALPGQPASARRLARGRRLLECELVRLVAPDGAFAQYSFNYHRVLLHVAVWSGMLLQRAGQPFSPAVMGRLEAATTLAAGLLDPVTGAMPCYGSNDGANILPLANADYRDHRPAVQLASVFSRGKAALPPGPWDEATAWLLGDQALTTSPMRPVPKRVAIASCGYYGAERGGSQVFFRCGSHRFRPHHADQLHVEIRRNGVLVAADAGTYSYNAPPPYDHAYSGTTFHNTVSVDGRDQMERAGRFLWLPWSGGELLASREEAELGQWWLGQYRWRGGVIHQRGVHVGPTGEVTVVDRLEATVPHDYTLHWLLADLPVEATQGDGALCFRLGDGSRWRVTVACSDPGAVSDRVRASEGASRGWMAPYYQRLDPAWSWETRCRAGRAWFATRFGGEPAAVRFLDGRVEVGGWSYDLAAGVVQASSLP